MTNQKFALVILTVSVLFSCWLYLGADIKLEKELTSREWQSTMSHYISPEMQEGDNNRISILSRIDVSSNVKYLPNGAYLRVSRLTMYERDNQVTSVMNISETGKWELSDDYLLIHPEEFKDTTTNTSVDFTEEHLDIIKTLFIMDAEQSRRVDVINAKAILLTSLNHGSRILSSN
ncbi:regulatory protein ToxS [Vibrio algarum]|uniref:Regulatory protein ToxS n=1 Tax=Vibrio algarum TaxID=3020714 RepID=A0ABT4YSL6_9VIBR|nr:regulatory protein ToxS [Vibrio sp. KJ40-1]MDB1124550.1 regulatory protein ToxS [Vibrio sp. KJ40-1]